MTDEEKLSVITDLWFEEFAPHGLCGLCGNCGIINTKGVKSPAGALAGDLFFCICPNGRTLKKHGVDINAIRTSTHSP